MRTNRVKLLYIPILLGGAIWLGSVIVSNADGGTTSAQPGSVDDPVITKSYFDQQINQKIAEAIAKQQPTTPSQTPSPTLPPATGGGGADSALEVVQLPPGKTLYAGAGTELIVRTGKTIAVSSDDNGIPDVTAGKDIAAGQAIETNHLLIFPREGRGVKPDPKSTGDIFIMVRGSYIIP
jgi:hypothetical protein